MSLSISLSNPFLSQKKGKWDQEKKRVHGYFILG